MTRPAMPKHIKRWEAARRRTAAHSSPCSHCRIRTMPADMRNTKQAATTAEPLCYCKHECTHGLPAECCQRRSPGGATERR